MTSSAQQAAAAMHRTAARLEAGPDEDRLAALETRVNLLTAAIAGLIAERHGGEFAYDDEEASDGGEH
jgi:hypothetical protein